MTDCLERHTPASFAIHFLAQERFQMRTYRSIALLCLLALTLGACSFGAPEPPAGAGPEPAAATLPPAETTTEAATSNVTITFGAIGFMRHIYEPLIAAFNQQHPGITVQFVSLEAAYRDNLSNSELVRKIVGMADTSDGPAREEEFELGLLRDLKPLADADATFDPADFYPSALASATSASGALYRLPATLEVPLLFYNKDLLAARGVAEPKPDWTWQDVAATAQQLARKQGDTVRVYGLADQDAYLATLLDELRGAGLDLLTTAPASARVDRPEVAQALGRMAEMFTSGAFYYPPDGADFRDAVAQMVANQQVAMWGSSIAPDIAKQTGGSSASGTGFTSGAAPFPPFPGGARDSTSGYIMSSGTQHPQEAWAWLSFLSQQFVGEQGGPTGSRITVPAGQGGKGGPAGGVSALPARKSLAEQGGYWSHLDDQTRAAIQAALSQPAPAASGMKDFDAYQPLIEAIQAIIGGKPAAQAASEAQAAITEQAVQAQQTPTATPNTQPIVVATPAPNAAPPGATTIRFGMPLAKGSDQTTQLVQEFNQSNQGVFVQLHDTFTGNRFLSVPAAAAQLDCFVSPMPPAQAELTATLDLQPLFDADASFQIDDYPAALLAPYRQGGQLRGLPWGVEFRALVYNKDLFDTAGLQPPSEQWTIDDFLDAAQKLTSGRGDTKQYGFVIPRDASNGVKFLLHLMGVELTKGSGETLTPNFTDPKVVQAVRKVVDLLKNNTPHAWLNDYAATAQNVDYGDLTGQGRAGMWFAWGLYAYGQNQPAFNMAMAPPPLAQATFDTDDISTSSMYISAQTDKQQACWTWLKNFSSSRVPGASNFPARRSAARADTANQAQPGMAAVYDGYIAALDRAGPLAPGGETFGAPPIDYYWLYRAIDRALQGKKLEQELAEAQALTEQYVACVRGGSQREAEACDRQVDPNYGQY